MSPSNAKEVHAAFYVLCRQLPSGDYTAVYRSEVIGRGTESFERIIRDVDAVIGGGGEDDTLLRLELYQFSGKGKHTQLAFVQISVEKLRGTAIGQPLTWWACNRLGPNDRSVRGGWSWGKRQMDVGQVVLVKKSVDTVRSKYGLSVVC